MKKKTIIITSFIIIGLILFFITTIFAGKEQQKSKIQERKEDHLPEKLTITCVGTEKKDDVEQTESIYLQNGILISRTDISSWNKSIPEDRTCTYYQKRVEKLNVLPGIASTVNCNASYGTVTTVYTIAEINREDIKLNELDYLDEKNIMDVDSWLQYMKKNKYNCVSQ